MSRRQYKIKHLDRNPISDY